MNKKKLRISYVPLETMVFVAEDGKKYLPITSDNPAPDYDDRICDVTVVPGASKIKIVNVSDDVEHYFWTFSNDTEFDGVPVGEDGFDTCIVSIPENFGAETALYIEEDSMESEYGSDHRDLFFRSANDEFSLGKEMFELVRGSND